jgi:hypothetical protein
MGNYHVRFCTGGGVGDHLADRSASDAASRPCIAVRFGFVWCFELQGTARKSRRA